MSHVEFRDVQSRNRVCAAGTRSTEKANLLSQSELGEPLVYVKGHQGDLLFAEGCLSESKSNSTSYVKDGKETHAGAHWYTPGRLLKFIVHLQGTGNLRARTRANHPIGSTSWI